MDWRPLVVFSGACLFLILCSPEKVFAQSVTVIVETRIKPPDFQAGMKSTQQMIVNFATQRVTNDFYTGVTDLVGVPLQSVRDSFQVNNIVFTPTAMSMTAVGQTASGVLLLPNINYQIALTIDNRTREVVLNGCHDGYPSYKVTVNRTQVYHFQQERITALFGSCDTSVNATTRY
jgi:hypothetical protein